MQARATMHRPLLSPKRILIPHMASTLKMPDDFSAYPPDVSPDLDADGKPTGEAIVLQNQNGDAVQSS